MTNRPEIEIIPFSEEFSEAIRILNYEWLERYFRVEEGDRRSLSDPRKYIIDKGGAIYYARLNNEIVGTASLLKKSDTVFELGKMAVTENARGYGIGAKLIEHCLNAARQKQVKTLILYSNTRLQPAIHLYRKFGFTETALEDGLYERADIKMEKQL